MTGWISSHRKVAAGALGLALLIAVALGSSWFGLDWKVLIGWKPLVSYVNPQDATDRKDAVQVYAIIVAGVVAAITAAVGLMNLRLTRKNLEQQRELEAQRGQGTALQAYYEQIGKLISDKDLLNTERREIRELARGQTLTVLQEIDGKGKASLLTFLHGAGLIGAENPAVTLIGANFLGAFLREAFLQRAALQAVNLQGADLKGADLQRANLQAANLQGANLKGADLQRAVLQVAGLSEADLKGANLSEADLKGADLVEADLRKAFIPGADLREAFLFGADLREAYLMGANLKGAHLFRAEGAGLKGAGLKGANLKGANLQRANLKGARGVTDEWLAKTASSLADAIMLNGQKYEDWLKDKESRTKDA